MKNKIFIGAIFPALFFSCSNPTDTGQQKKASEAAAKKSNTPSFNPDSAYAWIQQQVDFGPRVPQTEPHEKCVDFIIQKMKSYKMEVLIPGGEVIAYNGKRIKLKNIIASYKHELNKRILIAGHFDTRPMADRDTYDTDKPIDGACDGASEVAVMFEIARHVSQSNLNFGIDFIFFDMEDYGEKFCQGSEYWANNPHKKNYSAQYGILLDMVGAKGATFPIEGHSRQYAYSVVKKVWDKASEMGYSDYFVYNEVQEITDDHYNINSIANIPCIDIIHIDPYSGDIGPIYHHRHADNMSVIDKNTLKAVGQTLLEVIYSE